MTIHKEDMIQAYIEDMLHKENMICIHSRILFSYLKI